MKEADVFVLSLPFCITKSVSQIDGSCREGIVVAIYICAVISFKIKVDLVVGIKSSVILM